MSVEAFGENAVSQSKTFLWYKRFKDGRTSVDDDERSGRPSTSTTPENIAESSRGDQTVNGKFYCEVLKRLRRPLRANVRKSGRTTAGFSTTTTRPPTHRSLFGSFWLPVIPHPPYSPDLAPRDFFLFPKMKFRLKGRRFDTIEEIQAESQEVLKTLTLEDFEGCMESWGKTLGSLNP
ncbi:hypothetical protein L798_08168 [Zootermopsis nevadensis]|uniref:Mos1 transposase HTH domain-containing protein n=1 Tax=Zootermopsis nevadensis TaxID=136037 RepID=A0A067R4H0_ZOONE|nr:hypothetical protein L798_08168 [Zootermopsis nevadensis]